MDGITIAHTFYNQHAMIPFHLRAWATHQHEGTRYLIIDDGSPTELSLSASSSGAPITVARIDAQIAWNIAGARNLAFREAQTDWVLCADIDHVVTPSALRRMKLLDRSDRNVIFTFGRRRPDGKTGAPEIVNFLAHRETYWDIGGHDEDFSGHYGREETFFLHCIEHHKTRILPCADILLDWRPHIGATQNLLRDKSVNSRIYDAKMSALQAGTYSNGPILRFPWKVTTYP